MATRDEELQDLDLSEKKGEEKFKELKKTKRRALVGRQSRKC